MNKELFIYLMRNKPNNGNFIKPTVHNLALLCHMQNDNVITESFLSNTSEHFLCVLIFNSLIITNNNNWY